MCGIAGIVGVFERKDAIAAVGRMTSALARRGPDAEGLTADGGAVLGHRRLAIFDLSDAGNQPMRSADGGLTVVFNGAIYNFKTLRAELVQLGFAFRSATDTEVLLHGYRAWGIERLVRRLRGMFAFGLWDEELRKLFLVRDRLGVKPLLYTLDNETIAFASTARALASAGFGGAIDGAAVLDCLRWGFVDERHCIYKGLAKLPPATILEWCWGGETRQRLYWERPLAARDSRSSFGAAVEETEQCLREALAIRLDADVPVGILLSGGIDSSLICYMVAQLGVDLTAYTVSVPGDRSDETAAAVETARRLKIRHRLVPMAADDSLELDELVSAYDEPFACSSALAMLRVSRAVASSAKVLLTGDGGDDLFLGYPRHRHLWLAEKAARNLPPVLSAAWNEWGGYLPRLGPLRRAGAFMDYAIGGLPAFLQASTNSARQLKKLLGPRLAAAETAPSTPAESDGRHMLEAFVDFEHKTRFVGEYLRKVDGATMHHGLEARSPFLDQKLWELGSTLPVDLRLHGGRLKAILRDIVRQRIGARVALRKKGGFRIPVQRWMGGRLFHQVEQTLQDSLAAQDGWIERDRVLSELRRARESGTASEMIWKIVVLESWMRHEKERRAERRVGRPSDSPIERVVA